jgi:integrase
VREPAIATQATLLDGKPAGGHEPLPDPSNVPSGQPDRSLRHPGSDRLFPIGREQFWRLVHGYALAAGIPRRKCKTHMLKHTIAKHLVRAGHPLNEIQEWMGWGTIETMNWYTRADEEELGHRIGDTIRSKAGLRQVKQGNLFP